jgi:ubiquinone/menaquinone biosynthesis C-methylase UbiE
MDTDRAYDTWSEQYDANQNKTRDLEGVALRQILVNFNFGTVLEIGCGTGKNTQWLATKATEIIAVDFSNKMLEKAREKNVGNNVRFIQTDINLPWDFAHHQFDLVTCSLVLEHIENMGSLFDKISSVLRAGGIFYMGELHPFKQYTGSQARFDTASGRQYVKCFIHHVSDFTNAAKKSGMELVELQEFFDDASTGEMPRILSIVFRKL